MKKMNKTMALLLALTVSVTPISAAIDAPMAGGSIVAYAEDPIQEFVERFYREILGREGDPQGVAAWMRNLRLGLEAGADVGAGFIESDEFKNRNLDNEAYIRVLYRAFFDREADPAGLAGWMKAMDEGLTRRQVYRGFGESVEFGKLCESYEIERGTVQMPNYRDRNEGVTKFVYRCYKICLGREPDEAGLEGWCRAIIRGENSAKKAAYGFFFSDEYLYGDVSADDFGYVVDLYRLFLDREHDTGGLYTWYHVMDDRSRFHVFNGFADSPEFQEVCARYGIEYSGSGENVSSMRCAYSSNIGTYDGVLYTTKKDVPGMQRLQVESHKYDYVHNFAFYEGMLFFCCKEYGGTDYGNAIMACRPDGRDVGVFCDYPNTDHNAEFVDCTDFVIFNNVIYYDFDMMDETVRCLDITSGRMYKENLDDVYPFVRPYQAYYDEAHYSADGDRFIMGLNYVNHYGDIDVNIPCPLSTGTHMTRVHLVTPQGIYFTTYSQSELGILWRYNFSNRTLDRLVDNDTAGGGDPVFGH